MRNKMICWFSAISIAWLCASSAMASDQIGTLTSSQGDVKLFTHPSKTLQKGEGTHVFFEGEYYIVEQAKPGQKLEQGNILRTSPGAKARVIFDNGDQFDVGSGTAFRVLWNADKPKTDTRMDLAYGKVRGVIEKGGPRSHFQIRTKTATMGVRGTDFFIADGGADGGTEVSIIRGAVELKPKAADSKPIEVKSGFSATVAPPTAAVVAPAAEIRKTTQEELSGIQKSSTITIQAPATPQIAELQKKAVETTLKDIQTHDPKLFAQLTTTLVKSTDDLNGRAIQALVTEAPHAPEGHKPFKSEVDDLEHGAYEKYFKESE